MCNITRFRQPLSQLNISKRVLEIFLNQMMCSQFLVLRVTGLSFHLFFFLQTKIKSHFHSMLCAHFTHDSQRTVGNRNKQTSYELNHVSSITIIIIIILFFFSSWFSFFVFFIFKNRRKKEHIAHKNI